MSDEEFIIFLCKEMWECITGGEIKSFDKINSELEKRGINPDDIFVY